MIKILEWIESHRIHLSIVGFAVMIVFFGIRGDMVRFGISIGGLVFACLLCILIEIFYS